ncbi:MAG: hypothetical protein EZS28_050887 [Streblomastix strix]|uniref:Uncharacterized protein n=1 Tax=Streblomastix strix TaxID=222440 RepID=A0A5J4T5S2_9EUKA|nr:MAG: hypothetical protein EZS28_050887 [Streblomastix strix]
MQFRRIIAPSMVALDLVFYLFTNFAYNGKIDETNADAYELIYPYDGLYNTQVRYCKKCGIIQYSISYLY